MKFIFKTNQLFLWIVFRTFLVLSGSKYKSALSKSDIQNNTAYIIAANHQSVLDPFVIGATLPLSAYVKLTPLRFMAHWFFFKHWLMGPALKLVGAFPTKEFKKLPYGIEFGKDILEKSGTLCIFPEGTRTLKKNSSPKRGVTVLASMPNVKLLPVHLEWNRKKLLRRVRVVADKPVVAKALSPEQIMDAIYSL